MLKKIYIISAVIALSFFFGCTNSADVKMAENKNEKYQPVKLNNVSPVSKPKSTIEIEQDKEYIKKNEKAREQVSDFEKMMVTRKGRPRNR